MSMKHPLTKRPAQQRGFALLLSIIIASVVLAIGVSILKVSVSQLELSATGRESEIALQASLSLTECLTYHRYSNDVQFTARPGDPAVDVRNTRGKRNAPPIRCMHSEPFASYAEILKNGDDGHIVKYHYTYDWGDIIDAEQCSSGDMYVMVPKKGEDIQHVFLNTSVGPAGDGNKTCTDGNICTIWITQGYNRPCAELDSSLFTVQRELTTES